VIAAFFKNARFGGYFLAPGRIPLRTTVVEADKVNTAADFDAASGRAGHGGLFLLGFESR